jgi:hypothetical protein
MAPAVLMYGTSSAIAYDAPIKRNTAVEMMYFFIVCIVLLVFMTFSLQLI